MKSKVFTYAIALLALTLLGAKFYHYLQTPWTRDGLVRANIVEVTPRVTGPVAAIHVADNEHVNAGDLLFEIDDRTYVAAVKQGTANLAQAKAVLKKAENELKRVTALEAHSPGSVSVINLNNLASDMDAAAANVGIAEAQLESAQLNLEFTRVYASKSGFITNLGIVEGAQVIANQPVVALIDEQSFWVEAFFKETDLAGMRGGNLAQVTLMGYPDTPLTGVVESIGYGIAQSDGSTGAQLLPNVNPNFEWIRLAQRLPVKVKITQLPDAVELRLGTTASVQVQKQG